MARYSYCHGYTVDPNGYAEILCKRRAYCAYYQEDFYVRYRGQLDDFEEMFPFEPCQFFVSNGKQDPDDGLDRNERILEMMMGKKF